MTGKTHQLIGITVALGYFLAKNGANFNPATAGAILVGGYFSALLPDIDQPAAKIWHAIPFGHTISQIPSAFLEHRNLSHSLLGLAIFGYLLHWLLVSFPGYWGIDTNILFVACLASYFFHLLADMITVEGIPVFFPYQKMLGIPPHPFDGARMETGKWFENLVIFPIINAVLLGLIITNWRTFHQIFFK